MKLVINDIKNIHKNTPCIVIGHGPSLNNYKQKINEYKQKGYVLISTNNWYDFYDTVPNYCVICNHVYSVSRNYEIMNKYNTTIIYSDVQELTSRNRIDNILKVNYLPYDFRHFNNSTCNGKSWRYIHQYEHHTNEEVSVCCQHFIPGRLTIQEEIKKLSGNSECCGLGDTNVTRQIMFGMIMGCNPIYLIGIDLDYRQGYSKGVNENTKIENISVPEYQEDIQLQNRIHNDFRVLNDSAKLLNIKIINTNYNLIYNEFEKGDLN